VVIKPTSGNHSETVEPRNARLRKEPSENVSANATNSVRRENLMNDEDSIRRTGDGTHVKGIIVMRKIFQLCRKIAGGPGHNSEKHSGS
jgi:hypothetical protein